MLLEFSRVKSLTAAEGAGVDGIWRNGVSVESNCDLPRAFYLMSHIEMMSQSLVTGEKIGAVMADDVAGYGTLFTVGDMVFEMLGRIESSLVTELTLLIHDEQT